MLKTLSVAALLAAAPFVASAATLNPNNDVFDGGTFEVTNAPFEFSAQFNVGEAGDTFSFFIENTSDSAQAFLVTAVTVLQSAAQFAGGVTLGFVGDSNGIVVGQNQITGGGEFETVIAPGEIRELQLTFGNVVDRGNPGGTAVIGFTIEASLAAVPVPAAGLLLVTALGGMGLARRRKRSA